MALGGCFSEHSGVINIGLEGIMVIGALGGALMMKYMPDRHGGRRWSSSLTIADGDDFRHAVFAACWRSRAINFKADQTLVGTAMNLLGTAAATVIVKAINIAEDVSNVSSAITYINVKKAFLVDINGFEFNWFMLMAVGAAGDFVCPAVQDALRSAPAGLRRASAGGGSAWASTSTRCAMRA